MSFQFFSRIQDHHKENMSYIAGQGKLVVSGVGSITGGSLGAILGRIMDSQGVVGGSYLCSQLLSAAGCAIGTAVAIPVITPFSLAFALLQAVASKAYELANKFNRFRYYYGISTKFLDEQGNAAMLAVLCIATASIAGKAMFIPIGKAILPTDPDTGEKVGEAYGPAAGAILGYLSSHCIGRVSAFLWSVTLTFLAGMIYDPIVYCFKNPCCNMFQRKKGSLHISLTQHPQP